MKRINLEQNSPDWEIWRNKGIGSSDAPALLNVSPWKTPQELWTEKLASYQDRKEPTGRKENSAMKRGRKFEPMVRDLYKNWTGHNPLPACGVHDDYDFLKASFDGLIENELILEIKCPGVRRDGSSDHDIALDKRVPDKYIPQLIHQSLIANVENVHYISFGDPKYYSDLKKFVIVEFQVSKKQQEALLKQELIFWESVTREDFTIYEKTLESFCLPL